MRLEATSQPGLCIPIIDIRRWIYERKRTRGNDSPDGNRLSLSDSIFHSFLTGGNIMKIDIIIEPTRAKKVNVNITPAEYKRYIE